MGRRATLRLDRRVMAVALVTIAFGVGADPALASSQSHFWRAEGNATDQIGTADGVLLGGTTFADGKAGSAFAFDGEDDIVAFGTTTANFGERDFRLSFSINTTSTRKEGVIGKRPVCGNGSFMDIRISAAGKLVVELGGGGVNLNILLGQASLNDGVWHNVVLRRQGAMALLYVDDVLDASHATAGVTNISNDAQLVAGQSACSDKFDGTRDFTGRLDEIKVVAVR